jgi:hypothetical protein
VYLKAVLDKKAPSTVARLAKQAGLYGLCAFLVGGGWAQPVDGLNIGQLVSHEEVQVPRAHGLHATSKRC